jgi:hypothetical protein
MPYTVELSLRHYKRPAEQNRGVCLPSGDYTDYYIGDARLLDLLNISDSGMVTPFDWPRPDFHTVTVEELALAREPALPTGRCQLYVCPTCADIGCGAITVRVEAKANWIIWRDIAYEDEHGPRLDEYPDLGLFYFHANAYRRLLASHKP